MSANSRALLVTPTTSLAQSLVGWLRPHHFDILLVEDFIQARRQLALNPPDLLIAEIRLGAYNGLHLAIHAHDKAPVTTIVIGAPDPALEAEAQRQEATYLTTPVSEHAFEDALRRRELSRTSFASFGSVTGSSPYGAPKSHSGLTVH